MQFSDWFAGSGKNGICHRRTDYRDNDFTDSGRQLGTGDNMGRHGRHFIDFQKGKIIEVALLSFSIF
jgi:hypothetical protein